MFSPFCQIFTSSHEPQAVFFHPPDHLFLEYDVSTSPAQLYESWKGYPNCDYPDGNIGISCMFEYPLYGRLLHEEDLLPRWCEYVDDECESASVDPHHGRRYDDVHSLCSSSLRASAHHDCLGCDGMLGSDGTGGGIKSEKVKWRKVRKSQEYPKYNNHYDSYRTIRRYTLVETNSWIPTISLYHKVILLRNIFYALFLVKKSILHTRGIWDNIDTLHFRLFLSRKLVQSR